VKEVTHVGVPQNSRGLSEDTPLLFSFLPVPVLAQGCGAGLVALGPRSFPPFGGGD